MSVTSRIRKVLIANRGEIACRVIRSAKKLGIKTVGVYSDADARSMHVALSDEAYNIGKPPAQESYLRGDVLIEVAKKTGANAIHPGYGFLSENAEFARLCQDSGVIFIGPPPSAIRDMGIKSTSKEIMSQAGVPIVPGYHGTDQSESTLLREADKIGFPLMIKAVRGGGGKGMRIVRDESEFLEALESAKRESLRSFGDDAVLLERYIERPRHVEVQVFGDTHGNYVHLFERDCSIQRRHQKVIEQAPAPGLTEEVRRSLCDAGVKAAKAVGYVGAGTVEFILDTDSNQFYFMEMNTRLQVEHPVSEMVTGVDLVEWQLCVASGQPLPLTQDNITLSGHSLEARIYAEDVPAGFVPTAGHLASLLLPIGPHLRVETGVRSGDDVSVHYDPMIAKLVVWDHHISGAFSRLDGALSDFNVVGVKNNVNFLRKLCRHQDLINGNVHTGFIDQHNKVLIPSKLSEIIVLQAAVGLVLRDEIELKEKAQRTGDSLNPFARLASFRVNMTHTDKVKFRHLDNEYSVKVKKGEGGWMQVESEGLVVRCRPTLKELPREEGKGERFFHLTLETLTEIRQSKLAFHSGSIFLFSQEEDGELDIVREYEIGGSGDTAGKNQAVSPMPGIVDKIHVAVGQSISKGDSIAVVMAMKMEHIIKADQDGVVSAVLYKPGDSVGKNVPLVTFQN